VSIRARISQRIRHRAAALRLAYNARMTLPEFFLKQKEAGHARSHEVFALIRPEHMPWKPEKDALSVGEILRHLWFSEDAIRRLVLNGDFSYFETRVPKGLRAVLGAPGTLEEELKNIDRAYQETMTAVAALPAEAWDEERTHAGLGYRRKVAVILFGMNEHEVHHRAQLMTYLRMLGTPAPEPIRPPKK
jgi:uncharacterized damage-inducible protein DinB